MLDIEKNRVLEEISCHFFKIKKQQNDDGRWGYARFICVCEKGYKVSIVGCRKCMDERKNIKRKIILFKKMVG